MNRPHDRRGIDTTEAFFYGMLIATNMLLPRAAHRALIVGRHVSLAARRQPKYDLNIAGQFKVHEDTTIIKPRRSDKRKIHLVINLDWSRLARA